MDVLRKRGPENLIFRLSLRLFFRIFVLPKKENPYKKTIIEKTMKKEKAKSDKKDPAASPSFFRKVAATWHNETLRFIVGLMLVIFSVYLLLAISSFFFTGAADQSILDSGNGKDLMAVDNGVKNYAGARGAQLSSYLINDCFGISSFFILVFLAAAGLKLMKVRHIRLWRWFICC